MTISAAWDAASATIAAAAMIYGERMRRAAKAQDGRTAAEEATEQRRLELPIEGFTKLTDAQQAYSAHLLSELQNLQELLIQARDEIVHLRGELQAAHAESTAAHEESTSARAELATMREDLNVARREIVALQSRPDPGGTPT